MRKSYLFIVAGLLLLAGCEENDVEGEGGKDASADSANIRFSFTAPGLAKGIVPIASRLQDRGIRILNKQPKKALRGSFTQNAETIYFEAVRGKESQTWEFNGGPRYEVDVRFVDSTGRTFAAQAGGHSLVIPKWKPGVESVSLKEWDDQYTEAKPGHRVAATEEIRANSPRLYEIVTAAKPRILASELSTELSDPSEFGEEQPEWEAISSLSSSIRQVSETLANDNEYYIRDWDHLNAVIDNPEPIANTLEAQTLAASSTCTHWAGIYSMRLANLLIRVFYPNAMHSSAGAVKACSDIFEYDYSCNHGPCPGGTGMTLLCSDQWTRPHSDTLKFFAGQTPYECDSPYKKHCEGCCDSNYAFYWNPYPIVGVNNNGHVCNNDSKLQFQNVKHNTYQDASDDGPLCHPFRASIDTSACN